MGHYDTCRPENCAGCGQALGVVWNCGRRGCSTYHQWLASHHPDAYKKLMAELKVEREAAEERRVLERRKAKRKQLREEATAKRLDECKKKALQKLTKAERKLLKLE